MLICTFVWLIPTSSTSHFVYSHWEQMKSEEDKLGVDVLVVDNLGTLDELEVEDLGVEEMVKYTTWEQMKWEEDKLVVDDLGVDDI